MKERFFKSQNIVDAFLILVLIYFIYNTIVGNRGLFSYISLNQEIPAAQKTLSTLQKEREIIENKIQLLTSDNIDTDFLDELARRDLGLINENEKCFLFKTK